MLCVVRIVSYYRCHIFFCFEQNTAYGMRISDWSSDGCSSDLSIWQKPKSKISANQAHLIANARTFAFETYSPRLRLQKQPESVASSHLQSMDTSALEALASMARVLRALAFERHPIVDRPVC